MSDGRTIEEAIRLAILDPSPDRIEPAQARICAALGLDPTAAAANLVVLDDRQMVVEARKPSHRSLILRENGAVHEVFGDFDRPMLVIVRGAS